MKFVTGKPAAVVGDKLILCELHYGIEFTLQQKGVNIQLNPAKYAETLNELKRETGTSELVVIGDFKDNYLGFEQRERNYFNEFIAQLEFSKITIVKGTHDSQIEQMAKPFQKIHVAP